MPKYVVRFGAMRTVGVFSLSARGGDPWERGAKVIIRTNRGLEAGEVRCEAEGEAAEKIKDAGQGQGQMVRRMTAEDVHTQSRIRLVEREQFEACQQHVQALGLSMQLVDLEHLFG